MVVAAIVAVAGAAGVLSRYLLSVPFHGDVLPWVTVAINVAGSFLLGVLVVVDWWTPELRTAVGVGFLGGFTTFSTFSVQAVLDVEAGEPGRALLYIGTSVVAGIGAAWLGYLLGRSVMP
jgi:CrcB protein